MTGLVIWHVGGGDGHYGHAQKMAEFYPGSAFVLIEANEERREIEFARQGIVVNRCLAGRRKKAQFLVYKFAPCSSLFPINPHFGDEVTGNPNIGTWGEHGAIERTVEVETVAIDDLEGLPAPDFLSLDAQGSDYDILWGAQQTLANVMGIAAEFATVEVYLGQCLLHDQMKLLHQHNFRFVDFLHGEYWHQGPPEGLGFLTAGDALYLRDDLRALSSEKLAKLQMIARYFNRLSFATKIQQIIAERKMMRVA